MSAPRRFLISALALAAVSLALAVPASTANAAGTVTKVIVWGDSMSLAWPAYLSPLLGVPVEGKGVGGEDVQQTQASFNAWMNSATQAEINTTGHLCWCGHVNNNAAHVGDPTKDVNTIVPTLTAMRDYDPDGRDGLKTRVPAGLFMPIGLENGPDAPRPSEGYDLLINSPVNDPDYTIVDSGTAVNEKMLVAFGGDVTSGGDYAEVRHYLVTNGLEDAGLLPGTATDQANIAVDVPPESLRRVDDNPNDPHLSTAGKQVAASRLSTLIHEAGWIAPSQGLASVTTASSTMNPSEQGVAIRFKATVRPESGTGAPTGTVQFFVNGQPRLDPVPLPADGSGVVTSSSTAALALGENSIQAVYSGDSTFKSSSGFFIQVVNPNSNDTTPPAVKKMSPLANATSAGRGVNITATFNEQVTGVSGTTFTLTNPAGTVMPTTVTYSSTSFVATLNPTDTLAADTRYTARVYGGASAVQDSAGNPLATTSWTFLTGPPPKVTATSPVNGATGASRTASITATFNEAVNGVDQNTFTLTNAVTGAVVTAVVTRSGTTNKWILNPSATLAANTRYTMTLYGGPLAIRDLAGNLLLTVSKSFTTGA